MKLVIQNELDIPFCVQKLIRDHEICTDGERLENKPHQFDLMTPKIQRPKCRQAEQCIGNGGRGLDMYRHIDDEQQLGDFYCAECWGLFLNDMEDLEAHQIPCAWMQDDDEEGGHDHTPIDVGR